MTARLNCTSSFISSMAASSPQPGPNKGERAAKKTPGSKPSSRGPVVTIGGDDDRARGLAPVAGAQSLYALKLSSMACQACS